MIAPSQTLGDVDVVEATTCFGAKQWYAAITIAHRRLVAAGLTQAEAVRALEQRVDAWEQAS